MSKYSNKTRLLWSRMFIEIITACHLPDPNGVIPCAENNRLVGKIKKQLEGLNR